MEKITLQMDVSAKPKPGQIKAIPEQLVLDHCARCGGVWFEAGEVQRMLRCEAELLWREIVRREDPHTMLCHECRAPISRKDAKCAVCGWKVQLDCPSCARKLHVSEHDAMHLDYCKHCKGVWFDHHELAGIWRMRMGDAIARRRRSRLGAAADTAGDIVLLDALMFDPFLMYWGVQAGAHAAGAALSGLGNLGSAAAGAGGGVGEAIGEVAGAAGEAAAGVFETIVEIISGLFG
jgi:Zn-finger nucleic acid-binding protein